MKISVSDDERDLLVMGLNRILADRVKDRERLTIALAPHALLMMAAERALDQIAAQTKCLIERLATGEAAVAFVPQPVYAVDTPPGAACRSRSTENGFGGLRNSQMSKKSDAVLVMALAQKAARSRPGTDPDLVKRACRLAKRLQGHNTGLRHHRPAWKRVGTSIVAAA